MESRSWTAPIDIYCERLEPGLLAEPVNLLTNLSFIIAGVFAIVESRRRLGGANAQHRWIVALAVVVIAIGTGSALFHSFANRWSLLSDVIPIAIYMFLFIGFASGRLLGFGLIGVIAGCLGLAVLLWLGRQLPSDMFNGSNGYFGAAAGLLILGLIARAQANRASDALLIGFGLFCLSLLFRSIDIRLCEQFPLGTHFLWHTLNGAVLYCTMKAAILRFEQLRHNLEPPSP